MSVDKKTTIVNAYKQKKSHFSVSRDGMTHYYKDNIISEEQFLSGNRNDFWHLYKGRIYTGALGFTGLGCGALLLKNPIEMAGTIAGAIIGAVASVKKNNSRSSSAGPVLTGMLIGGLLGGFSANKAMVLCDQLTQKPSANESHMTIFSWDKNKDYMMKPIKPANPAALPNLQTMPHPVVYTFHQ